MTLENLDLFCSECLAKPDEAERERYLESLNRKRIAFFHRINGAYEQMRQIKDKRKLRGFIDSFYTALMQSPTTIKGEKTFLAGRYGCIPIADIIRVDTLYAIFDLGGEKFRSHRDRLMNGILGSTKYSTGTLRDAAKKIEDASKNADFDDSLLHREYLKAG